MQPNPQASPDRGRRTITIAVAATIAAAATIATVAIVAGGDADTMPSAKAPARAAGAPPPSAGAADGSEQQGWIAFMRPGSVGEYDIWAVRGDGTGLRRLTQSPANRSDYNPAWSPDGSLLLFERRVLDQETDGDDLYVVRSDGKDLRKLTDCSGECWAENEARWSPDGRRIVFNRATGPPEVGHPSEVAIWLARSDGTGLRRLTRPPRGWEDHYPTWSADGRTIVFERDRSTTPAGRSKLIAVKVATGAEREVHALPAWAPSAGAPRFSPDGRRILFGHWCAFGDGCPESSRARRNATLATIRPNGRGLRLLPLRSPADSGTWSPDGKRIAFRCRADEDPVGEFRLCTSRPDGSDLKRFPWPLESVHPDWGRQS